MVQHKTLSAFKPEEYSKALVLLATKVASMMGRKLEEDDWKQVYCGAKNLPNSGWSNLEIDIMHKGMGIEEKMLRVTNTEIPIREYCGKRLMHPAETRSIRIPSEQDPTKAARNILQQYTDLIEERRKRVKETAPEKNPDMRRGWLLWQGTLREFLYFEEEMIAPNPDDYTAEWHESGGGSRKKSKTLWVTEKDTGIKRYSVTTEAGAKIQPYFDVPRADEPNLYYFCVQGERVREDLVRIWINGSTAESLKRSFGSLDTDSLSKAIMDYSIKAQESSKSEVLSTKKEELARGVIIKSDAYKALKEHFAGISDEQMIQELIQFAQSDK